MIPAYLEFIDRFSYFPLYFDEIIDGKRIQTYLILTRFDRPSRQRKRRVENR